MKRWMWRRPVAVAVTWYFSLSQMVPLAGAAQYLRPMDDRQGPATHVVETALGLAVAIPAVLAFNYLSQQIARAESGLASAAGELIDLLEGWGEGDTHALKEVRRDRVA